MYVKFDEKQVAFIQEIWKVFIVDGAHEIVVNYISCWICVKLYTDFWCLVSGVQRELDEKFYTTLIHVWVNTKLHLTAG